MVASRILESETDPTRRRQLATFRRAALLWWVAGLVVAVIAAIVVISIASAPGLTGFPGGACRGGPDKFDPMSTTYESVDGAHWTATYPCMKGRSTTIPVPWRDVPAGGR